MQSNTILRTLGALTLAMGLAACSKAVRLDHDPSQREQALMSAKQFLHGFAASDKDQVLAVISAPFWADGKTIWTLEELKQELGRELNKKPKHLEVLEMQLFKTSDIRLLDDDTYEDLEKANMHKDTYLAAVEVAIDQDRETVFILLKPDEKGSWKVIGLQD